MWWYSLLFTIAYLVRLCRRIRTMWREKVLGVHTQQISISSSSSASIRCHSLETHSIDPISVNPHLSPIPNLLTWFRPPQTLPHLLHLPPNPQKILSQQPPNLPFAHPHLPS